MVIDMSEFLYKDEIKQLTDRVRYAAQRKALESMKIPFSTRLDGSVVVSREAARAALGVMPDSKNLQKVNLNLEAL